MKNKFLIAAVALIFIACTKSSNTLSQKDSSVGFAQKQIRYMTPFDLLSTLAKTFPGGQDYARSECKSLSDQNRGILGDSSASSGSPIFQDPNSGFVRWYVGCVKSYAQGFSYKDQKSFYGPTLNKLLATDPYAAYSPFSKLPVPTQLSIIEDQIERMIGPSEVIEDFGYYKSSAELAQHILDSLTDLSKSPTDEIVDIVVQVAIRDEFLSY